MASESEKRGLWQAYFGGIAAESAIFQFRHDQLRRVIDSEYDALLVYSTGSSVRISFRL